MPSDVRKRLEAFQRFLSLRYSWAEERFSILTRIILVFIYGIYISLVLKREAPANLILTFIAVGTYISLQFFLLFHARKKGFSLSRLILSGIADIMIITYGVEQELLYTDHFPFSFWIYFLVIIGNSFRYSPVLGLFFGVISLLTFTLVTILVYGRTGSLILSMSPISGLLGLLLITLYIIIYSFQFLTELYTDPLTGLRNRGFLKEIMRTSPEKYKALLLLDVNDFKKINDTYGHLAGDMVLVKVAETLREALRGEDVVIRWGGDEFLILIPGETDIDKLIKRIKERFDGLFIEYNGKRIPLKISLGGSEVEWEEGFDLTESAVDTIFTEAIKRADEAMYSDKAKEKNANQGD